MTQIFFHTYFQAKINLHANNISKMSTLKFVFHFTISLASGNILIYVGQRRQRNSSVGQTINFSFTLVGQNVRWFPLYVGQFHQCVGQCPWLTDILRPDYLFYKTFCVTCNQLVLLDISQFINFDGLATEWQPPVFIFVLGVYLFLFSGSHSRFLSIRQVFTVIYCT
jgi:hypothetical protein